MSQQPARDARIVDDRHGGASGLARAQAAHGALARLAADLLGRLRSGDAAAFEELVRSMGPRLLAVTRRLLRNEDDARDAVQDAYLSAFRGLPAFDGNCQLLTWLHRIAVNAALMKLRRSRRRPEARIDDLLPEFAGP